MDFIDFNFHCWRYAVAFNIERQTEPNDFRADQPHGSPRYRRAMRAHANFVENLPVYGAIIFGVTLLKMNSPILNAQAIIFITVRVCQTVTHVAFTDTNRMALIRFLFFFIQILIMFWMVILMITHSSY
jgi:uncharacterized MAPEG superfamily protein